MVQPGGTLRVIVGKSGENSNDSGLDAFYTHIGHGGGASALLYRPPNQTWESGVVLIAGGGGGGTYQGVFSGSCVDSGADVNLIKANTNSLPVVCA